MHATLPIFLKKIFASLCHDSFNDLCINGFLKNHVWFNMKKIVLLRKENISNRSKIINKFGNLLTKRRGHAV